MNITFTQLRAFCAVAETRNFRVAGERLHLSQSGVSVQVAGLERALRVALIDRRRSGWRLTPAGEVILERSRAIIEQGMLLEREAADIRSSIAGQFVLGATLTIADHSLPFLLGDYVRAHPEVRVSARVQNTRDIEAALLSGELDVALVEGSITSDRLIQVPYATDELVLICSIDNPLAERHSVTPAAFLNEPFIAREPGSGSRSLIEERLGRSVDELNLRIEFASVRAILTAVASGMGVALVSRDSAAEGVADGSLLALDVEGVDLTRTFRLVHAIDGPRNKAARAFAAHVRALATQMLLSESVDARPPARR
jgi:LysR family transcriptional regulator, transcriptional activator of the cysJI operon